MERSQISSAIMAYFSLPPSITLLLNPQPVSMGLFVNNGTSHMGRLEVCLGVTFGSVYDKNWSTAGASVVCRQLDHRPKVGRGQGAGGRAWP